MATTKKTPPKKTTRAPSSGLSPAPPAPPRDPHDAREIRGGDAIVEKFASGNGW